MDDMDRQFIRAQIFWRDLRRLGVSAVICACKESNPACFLPENLSGKINGNEVHGTCANCLRKAQGAKNSELLGAKIAALKKRDIKIFRCLCGEANPLCLEADHVDGQRFGDEVYPLCCNCHLKRTARQLSEHGGIGLDPENPLAILNKIGGVADYLEFAVTHLRETEDRLWNIALKGNDSSPGERNETCQGDGTAKRQRDPR